ncbi:hypothetical protein [Herbiconiux sp. VKM Ac-2851]|uniref:hypothetical protein n=1 Tax=Herbiconiux sp. VKM Ac-2851 TaxID=2739025 RepID=UPI001563A25B|nr:hypothetical protein [Herbiconiux sp. VKM Ac-2851]NQX36640.1 hypothetical protein [Herbiconiux sp. VKM Ac-2851]
MPSTPPLPPLPPLPPSFGGRDDEPAPAAAVAPAPAPARAPAAAPAPAATPAPVSAPAEASRWEIKRPGNPLPGTAPAAPRRAQQPRPGGHSAHAQQPRPEGHSAHAQSRPPRNRLLVPGLVLAGVAFLVVVVLGVVFAVGVIGATSTALFGGQAADGGGPAAAETEVVPALYDQTVTYDDGLQISVAAPESFSPSPQASGAGQPANIAVTVTVYNGSSADFVPGTVTSVVSAGASGNPIVDPSNGMTGLPPAATVPPGATVSYVEAYSVADADDVVYVVTPAAAYLPARFTR